METALMLEIARSAVAATPRLLEIGQGRYWVDYDQEADVLYISFQRPQKATNSVLTDDGVLLRYMADELVGITVMDASTRA